MNLDVDGVTVAFGARLVLDDVSLQVDDGEVLALLGESGSGKSTLLRVIAGLLRPQRGTIHVGGRDVTTVPTHQRSIGMVFQDEQLFPNLDVGGNVAFGLRMAASAPGTVEQRVAGLLGLLGLDGLARRSIDRLSGGEAKRVALARSLAPRPAVLLLDEPLTGLDRDLHDRLASEVATMLRAEGTTAVLVTHDRDEAATIAHRSIELADLQHGGAWR